jgi:hypothetical protein
MSASLMVLLPVMLLAVVGTLWFVGCFLDSGPERRANDPPTILFGQANHLVATFDGATLIIFVNGVISAQAAMPAMSAFVPSVSPTPLSFGITSVGTPPPQSPFNGEIQDVAFYSAALDAATILNHFKIGIGG